jgi:glycosyltransferase involved in cell wall biosynthesis
MGHEVTVACSRPSSRAGLPSPDVPYRLESYRLLDLPAGLHEASYFAPLRLADRRRFRDFVRSESGTYDRVLVHGLLETIPRQFLLWFRGAPSRKLISLQYGISTADYSRILSAGSWLVHESVGRLLVSRMGTIVVFSSESESELRSYFGPMKGKNVVRETLGIDTAAFANEWASVAQQLPAGTSSLESRSIRPPFIFAIGRNNRMKGFDTLLESFGQLAKEFPSLSLVLAGERTPFTNNLESAIGKLDLQGRVLILGRISPWDRMALLTACTVFAIPSRKEGFGLNAVHARILSKPTVATATGAHVQILGNDGPFWIVPPGDVPALTEALRDAVNRGLATPGIDASQLSRFDINTLAAELLKLG